jgi:hypothetical protein
LNAEITISTFLHTNNTPEEQMKKITMLFFAAALLVACSRKSDSIGQIDNPSQVQFSYELVQTALRKGVDLSAADSIRFTIDSGAGNAVRTDTVLPIVIFPEVLTEPIVLPIGVNYRVTKYEVLDGDSVIYRTPDTTSARDSLGQLITKGLPYNFSVFEDSVTIVDPQVLQVLNQDPENFGVPYYGLDTVPTFFYDFEVSYFDTSASERRYRLTNGHIDVQLKPDGSGNPIDTDVVDTTKTYRYSFGDSLSTIRLIDHSDLNYILSIVSTGTGTTEVNLDTLIDTLTTAEIKAHEEATGYLPDDHVLQLKP